MSDSKRQPKRYAIGNWKMNGDRASLSEVAIVAKAAKQLNRAEAMLCLPGPLIATASDFELSLGGQDCSPELAGAFTGDQSATLLADIGASAVIVGHSDRRTIHGETSKLVSAKASAAWAAGLQAIVCIGETAEEREAGKALNVLTEQLAASLSDGVTHQNTIVAYEPVWAIGTGLTASPYDIEMAHTHIRQYLRNRFAYGTRISLLYGGSLKGSNAAQIFSVPDVNGGLIGGASLRANDFVPIMQALDQT
ncbi:MAG: triose-phosphate isomerase [Verrucomicrobia bacterium]|jgi:triosephosphate isomerase (TIM)|nr:triose-phosphate isomerase [Verrucomicrobiota bacterium]MBT6097832.1 triose-phosphate isomerase [Marinovum sp.]MBT6526799.1 triose-phosphate isomerase [Marinovum sp.]